MISNLFVMLLIPFYGQKDLKTYLWSAFNGFHKNSLNESTGTFHLLANPLKNKKKSALRENELAQTHCRK